jgi:hypothetical protein
MEFPVFPATDDGTVATARARIEALAVLLRASKPSVDESALVEGSSENIDGPDPTGHWNTLKGELDRVLRLLGK